MNQIDLVKLNEYTINLIEAAREYLARKDDENRVLQFGHNIVVEQSHAHGSYSYYDWIPFASEACKCCTSHNGHKMTGRTPEGSAALEALLMYRLYITLADLT